MAGGDSSEYEVSINSASQVKLALEEVGYKPYVVLVRGRKWLVGDYEVDKNDFSITVNGQKITFDYAMIMIHGTPGENGLIQGYLDIVGVPYSSCGVLTSALTFSKYMCKKALAGCGVNMAREIYLTRGETFDSEAIAETLGLPLFVKPDASGSSCGVTKVRQVEDIAAAVEMARTESENVIIEEFICGTEVGCGMMIVDKKEYVFPITELLTKNDFFDYEAKYTPGMTDEITPARIDKAVADQISRVSMQVYKRLGCRGIVRIDYIIRDGIPYFIEANTVPGMSSGSIIPKQIAACGMTMGQVLEMVINDTANTAKKN